MDLEFCIEYRGIDFIVVVTGYDFTPGQRGTYYQPEEPSELDCYEGYVQVDCGGFPSPTEIEINRQLKEDGLRMFDAIWESDSITCQEKAWEEYLEQG